MSTVTVRQLSAEEAAEVMHPLTSYAFSPSPPLRDKAEFLASARTRRGVTSVAAFEDNHAVAVVSAFSMTQNVRGELFGASGIAGIATHPAARRQGYVRQSMAVMLARTREAGMPLSALYPFRESFYERLGYVNSARPRIARFAPVALTPLLKRDLGGQVAWLPLADGYDPFRDYVIRLRARTHGMAVFSESAKDDAIQRNDYWVALAQVDGDTVGAMLYNLRHEGGAGMTLKASRFYADTAQARYLLLQWIARHADQAGQAELRLLPTELPETWFPDLRVTVECGSGPMVRVVDIAGIQGMPAGQGGVTVHLTDPLCPWNEGRWRLEAADGRLCVSSGSAPEGEVSIHGLTGLVFGTHGAGDFAFRGWGHPPPGVQAALHALFPPAPPPYLHETF